MADLTAALAALGRDAVDVVPLAGDASTRRFYRVRFADGSTLVACLYPEGREHHARHDAAVHRWCRRLGLPVPDLLGRWGRLVLVEDLGASDLGEAPLAAGLLTAVLEVMASFQRCAWQDGPNPAFDARLLRRELAAFEVFAATGHPAARAYLDALAERVARHPYVLVHRDFHVNNLIAGSAGIRCVDFQDLRGGPDTYDLVSFLRERGGARLIPDADAACAAAAARLSWAAGWRDRYRECAAQRGLKVVGTFLRLMAAGRAEYAALLPGVREASHEALDALGAPAALQRAVATAGL